MQPVLGRNQPEVITQTNPRQSVITKNANHIRVASFNVLNYDNGATGFPTERGATTQAEFDKVFGFVETHLLDKDFLVADRLTGADFMLGFVLNGLLYNMQQAEHYPNIKRYVDGLSALPSWQAAVEIEQQGVAG